MFSSSTGKQLTIPPSGYRMFSSRTNGPLRRCRKCASKKKLHNLCIGLARCGRKTLVGYGDYGLTTSSGVIKGCTPGPSGRLRRELGRYCKVVVIDEFRTSKTCNCCKQRCFRNMRKKVRDDETGRITYQNVHSVLHCRNSGCLSMTVNRDVNASRNILEILRAMVDGLERPEPFRRGR
jgi:hypothetical protein